MRSNTLLPVVGRIFSEYGISSVDNSAQIDMDYAPPLITDRERAAYVDRYLNPDRRQDWYAFGYQECQQSAPKEVVKIISAASQIVNGDKTRQTITGLASIIPLMATSIANAHRPAGSG